MVPTGPTSPRSTGPGTARPRSATRSPTDEVTTTLFRALAVVRLVVLLYAIAVNAGRWREFEHPAAGWAVIAVMVLWTGFVTWAYDEPRRRRPALVVADLVVACGALLSTPYVLSDSMLERHASTIPTFWVMGAVLACTVLGGWVIGVAAAAAVSLCDLATRTEINGQTWGNIFLLLLAAAVIGYSTDRLREATEARARAERVAAAMEERARLARVVHDGVLQVLALVQRRGREIGGDVSELGLLAGEQEVKLRALVQGDAAVAGQVDAGETIDLVAALAPLGTRTVTVSGPGGPVLMPGPVVAELGSVVRACLDNVTRHVGADAAAWVLVEDLGGAVVVTVRDEGPGIPAGRLEAAAADGRLGVSESVRGRIADLGGSAVLLTGPGQGTEWELSVPR